MSATRTAAAAAALAAALALPATAQDGPSAGEQEYMNSCASCHGAEGRGDGPLADLMTVEVPDLTGIAERNDGAFPFQEVFMIIDGRTDVRGHGYPMPVWGRRYEEAAAEHGPYGQEVVVRGRILSLVRHLEQIQE
jgi:mono/diheme cytochrome c family protein